MLSRTRAALRCRRYLLVALRTLSPTDILHQVRFIRHKTQQDIQMYPDHLKKVILGPATRSDPETRKIYLKDIEAIRAHNLMKLKGFTKGRLYNSSIHGKAEMIQEIMRAYDRQATQQLYKETGIVRPIANANFYLARAYYILRNRGPWLNFRLTRELERVQGQKRTDDSYTRFSGFASLRFDRDSGPGGNDKASTPFRIWGFNYQLFVRRMTSITGSQHERDWARENANDRWTIEKQVLEMVEDFEKRESESGIATFPKSDLIILESVGKVEKMQKHEKMEGDPVTYAIELEDEKMVDKDSEEQSFTDEKPGINGDREEQSFRDEDEATIREREKPVGKRLSPEEVAIQQWRKSQGKNITERRPERLKENGKKQEKFLQERNTETRAQEKDDELEEENQMEQARESDVGSDPEQTPSIEIWKPNQQDAKSRAETFSALPPNLVGSLQKDINSEWTPHKWNELNLYNSVQAAIQSAILGHLHRSDLKLTDIQSLAIPILTKLDNENFHLDPKDHPELRQSFLLAAETGTGKTLAYLAPLLNKLKREEEWGHKNSRHPRNIFERQCPAMPRAIILCPTSELTEQIYRILKKLCHDVRFSVAAFLPRYSDRIIRQSFLSREIDILVSSPARLLDFIQKGELKTHHVSYLIVDEADSLFDRSFAPDVNTIIRNTRTQLTHLVLVSATIPMALERMLRQHYPEMQRIVTPKIHSIPRRLDFSVSVEEDKLAGLYQLLMAVQEGDAQKDSDVKRAIVFCNTRDQVKEVYEFLVLQQESAVQKGREPVLELIPFTRENYDRHSALERFIEEAESTDGKRRAWDQETNNPHTANEGQSGGKKLRVLITTDMGSRGLDTVSAKLVILYDVPYSNIDLIHRLGRTARAGTRGRAVMLLSRREAKGTIRGWIDDVRDKIIRGQALV